MKSNKTNTKKTVFSIVFVIAAVMIVVLVNILGVLAGEKFHLKADFTVKKVYSLSDETKAAVSSLERDTKIYILANEAEFIATSTYFKQANDIINLLPKTNAHISIEYIDLNKNPGFLNKYAGLSLHQGDLIVEQGEEYVGIPSSKLFHIEEQGEQVYIRSSRAESAMTSALLSLGNPDTKTVAFATDKKAYDASTMTYLLEDNYYISKTCKVSDGDIPKDTDILVLFSPMEDYTQKEIQTLKDYLKKPNTSIVYIADLEQPVPKKTPNITSFLKEYGILLQGGVVYETDSRNIVDSNPYSMKATYEYYSVAGKVPESGLYPVVPFARPLRIGTPSSKDTEVFPLLKYASSVVIRPELADSSWTPADEEKHSDLKGAVMAQTAQKSNLLVIPTASYFSSNNLISTGVSNAEYFVTLLNHLSERKDAVAIADKSLNSTNYTISQSQVSTLMVFFAIFLPASVLLLGALTWFKRRKQ